jgi:hypothetical protein
MSNNAILFNISLFNTMISLLPKLLDQNKNSH